MLFGDVCAGPGGFSEYILWRKNWHAKGSLMTIQPVLLLPIRNANDGLRVPVSGFGMTIVGDMDFNLAKFSPQVPLLSFPG